MAKRRTTETAQAFRSEYHDIRRQLEPIVTSIEEAIAGGGADAKKVIAEKGQAFMALASEMVDSVAADTADIAGGVAARAVERTSEATEDGVERLEDCIRRNPLTSVSLAFVSGWVLSRIVARR